MNNLPPELLIKILSYLSFQDHLSLKLVNKVLHNVSRFHQLFTSQYLDPDSFERHIPALHNRLLTRIRSLSSDETLQLLIIIGSPTRSTDAPNYHTQIYVKATKQDVTIRSRSHGVVPATSLAVVLQSDARNVFFSTTTRKGKALNAKQIMDQAYRYKNMRNIKLKNIPKYIAEVKLREGQCIRHQIPPNSTISFYRFLSTEDGALLTLEVVQTCLKDSSQWSWVDRNINWHAWFLIGIAKETKRWWSIVYADQRRRAIKQSE